jgi:PEP-CTERM motif
VELMSGPPAVVTLDSDQARFLYSFDDTGAVVLSSYDCANFVEPCYEIFVDGGYAFTTDTPPELNFHGSGGNGGGGACPTTFTEPGYVVTDFVCANGRIGWIGYLQGENPLDGAVFLTEGLVTDIVAEDGDSRSLEINDYGDLVWDDVDTEFWDEAFDPAATPEPGSVVLLMTGALAVGGAAWKRRKALLA